MQSQVDTEMKLDRGLWFGKMFPVLFQVTKAPISEQSSKKQSASFVKKPPLFLCLKTDGQQPDASLVWTSEEISGVSHGVYSMHSFGECPSVAVESHLSQILEDYPLQRYYLSAKACQGILNRAERRGKKLPDLLKKALYSMIRYWESPPPHAHNPSR